MLDYLNESETLPGKLASGLSSVMQMVGLGFLGKHRRPRRKRAAGALLCASRQAPAARLGRGAPARRTSCTPRSASRSWTPRGAGRWQSRPSRKRGSPPATLHRAWPTTCASSSLALERVCLRARGALQGPARGRQGAGRNARQHAHSGGRWWPWPTCGPKQRTPTGLVRALPWSKGVRIATGDRLVKGAEKMEKHLRDDLDAFKKANSLGRPRTSRQWSCRLRRAQCRPNWHGVLSRVRPQRARSRCLSYSISTVDYVGISQTNDRFEEVSSQHPIDGAIDECRRSLQSYVRLMGELWSVWESRSVTRMQWYELFARDAAATAVTGFNAAAVVSAVGVGRVAVHRRRRAAAARGARPARVVGVGRARPGAGRRGAAHRHQATHELRGLDQGRARSPTRRRAARPAAARAGAHDRRRAARRAGHRRLPCGAHDRAFHAARDDAREHQLDRVAAPAHPAHPRRAVRLAARRCRGRRRRARGQRPAVRVRARRHRGGAAAALPGRVATERGPRAGGGRAAGAPAHGLVAHAPGGAQQRVAPGGGDAARGRERRAGRISVRAFAAMPIYALQNALSWSENSDPKALQARLCEAVASFDRTEQLAAELGVGASQANPVRLRLAAHWPVVLSARLGLGSDATFRDLLAAIKPDVAAWKVAAIEESRSGCATSRTSGARSATRLVRATRARASTARTCWRPTWRRSRRGRQRDGRARVLCRLRTAPRRTAGCGRRRTRVARDRLGAHRRRLPEARDRAVRRRAQGAPDNNVPEAVVSAATGSTPSPRRCGATPPSARSAPSATWWPSPRPRPSVRRR